MMRILRKGERYVLNKPNEKNYFLSSYIRQCIVLLIGLFSFQFVCLAQESRLGGTTEVGEVKPLIVGQKVPEEFWTREHLFYVNGDTVRKNLEEYRGKLLLVDFWATQCAICWYQMKDLQCLSIEHKDKFDFLFVSPKSTKDDFDKISITQQTRLKDLGMKSLATVFEDRYFSSLFHFRGYPSYMWISPSGHFIAHTGRQSVTDGHIEGILALYTVENE